MAWTGRLVPLAKIRHVAWQRRDIRDAAVILGAGLWRCLEIAFFVFMGIGAVAGVSYLYKPIVNLMRKRMRAELKPAKEKK